MSGMSNVERKFRERQMTHLKIHMSYGGDDVLRTAVLHELVAHVQAVVDMANSRHPHGSDVHGPVIEVSVVISTETTEELNIFKLKDF